MGLLKPTSIGIYEYAVKASRYVMHILMGIKGKWSFSTTASTVAGGCKILDITNFCPLKLLIASVLWTPSCYL